MRIILLSFLLTLVFTSATEAKAETYKVWQYTDDVYVVLMESSCQKPKTGSKVQAIRNDGRVINGCYVPDVKNMIRITWDNNDFAVLDLKTFVPMSDAMFKMLSK